MRQLPAESSKSLILPCASQLSELRRPEAPGGGGATTRTG